MNPSYERKKEKVDESKPCRCGSGFFCHQHLRYGMPDEMNTPKIQKVSKSRARARAKTGARGDTMGGQH